MLEEGKRAAGGDHEHHTVKEETMSVLGPGVDLNIGLPIGGFCDDANMEDEEEKVEEEANDDDVEDDEDEGEMDEWKPAHGSCKVEKEEHGEAVVSVEGSNSILDMGEFGVAGAESSAAMSSQYWIPTPAQILVGPVQFVCHVCNKNFNRYNNMQVNGVFLLAWSYVVSVG
jgi:hypothetical protein